MTQEQQQLFREALDFLECNTCREVLPEGRPSRGWVCDMCKCTKNGHDPWTIEHAEDCLVARMREAVKEMSQ